MTDLTAPSPGPLLKMSGAYWEGCALHAGVRLDLFTAIDEGADTSSAVAHSIGADIRATEMLLNALAAMGLLSKEADRFANTDLSAAFLSTHSPRYVGYIIRHHAQLMDSWSRLDEAVLSGGPVRQAARCQDETARRDFLMGMFNLAMGLAPVVSEAVNLSGRRRLLDLGGGPGTYSVFFCRNHPNLRAVVYDLETTRPFAEETIRRFDLSNRIGFQGGDYVDGEITGRYDCVWMSHILHGEGPETVKALLDKVVGVLEPGGIAMIHDFILADTMDGPLFPALFSLNMLLGTRNGQAYSDAQIRGMMTGAGLKNIQKIKIDSPNDSNILIGYI